MLLHCHSRVNGNPVLGYLDSCFRRNDRLWELLTNNHYNEKYAS